MEHVHVKEQMTRLSLYSTARMDVIQSTRFRRVGRYSTEMSAPEGRRIHALLDLQKSQHCFETSADHSIRTQELLGCSASVAKILNVRRL